MFRLLSSVAAFVGIVSAQVPIPNRPDGYALGGPADAPIVFEAFYDLMCPDSRASWPVVQQVISHYANNLHFRLHTFPLPYHTWSHVANQGAHVVGKNATAAFAWTDAVFSAQEAFGNAATAENTRTQVLASFAALAEKSGITSAQTMLSGLNDANQDWDTRVSWKYGCSRGITGTPQFLVNGVAVVADPSWSLSDWQFILDSLISQSTSFSSFSSTKLGDCPAGQEQCEYLPSKFQCCTAGEACVKNVGCRC